MLKRLLLFAAAVLLLPLTAAAQWTFEGIFPQDTLAVNSGHGIAVDPDGKVWFQPFSATDSVQVPDLNNEFQPVRVIYVFNADGSPASFSPIKFVDLPGGERDTLGGEIEVDANGVKAWNSGTRRSGRGLRADYQGNILVAQDQYLYKLDYQTGAGMARAVNNDICAYSAPAVDENGNVYAAPVCPGPPIQILDSDLQFVDNAVDVTHGFSRSFEVSADGNTIYWAGYTNHAVVVYQRPDEFSPYDSVGVVLQGMDSESMTINRVTGDLWLSAGSPNDLPNRYPGVQTNWLPQTWYAFSLDSLVPNEAPPAPLNLFSWQNSPEWSDGRPRGLAFSPDGETAYVTQFSQIAPSVQVFNAAPFEQPDFTVRDINAIAQANIDALNAAGANLQAADIPALIQNDLLGTEVTITVVVLSDPLNSGLSTPDATTGFPSRVHVFARDVNAATLGPAGMGIQLVDGSYQTTGLFDVGVGDVIRVTGGISAFGTTLQFAPTAIEVLGSYQDQGLPDSILEPVLITTADANMNMGDGTYQVNWNNLASLTSQYVRIEGATMTRRDISTTRPNWLFSSDNGETALNFYDTSLRYRNDRSGYSEAFNRREQGDDFLPPPPGARINIQGFIVNNGDDPFGVGTPNSAILSINPMEDSDVEITEAPPIVSQPSRPDFVPTSDAITITADVTVDPTRTLTSVMLKYTTSSDATEQMVAMTNTSGETYSAEIPAQTDGDFVSYMVEATDSEGAVSTSDPVSTRFLADGINEIADVQLTADGDVGSSPFAGLTTPMSISATVQSDPATSGLFVIQDNSDLDGWSGIFLGGTVPPVGRGDVVSITSATITESFGVTQLNDPVLTVTTPGGVTLGYKTVTTDVLQNSSVAEAHEGMMLRFENVTIVQADARFGEWSFSSDGTADNAVNADDASNAISSSFNTDTFVDGAMVGVMQGVWWYSFGNFKLVPESDADVSDVTGVSVEEVEGTLPNTFALHQNYPNPFNPVTTITYDVPANAHVTLQVYDMMGREVTTLVDAPQTTGTFRVTFDARDLASGTYLYRLTAGTQVLTKTMILLK